MPDAVISEKVGRLAKPAMVQMMGEQYDQTPASRLDVRADYRISHMKLLVCCFQLGPGSGTEQPSQPRLVIGQARIHRVADRG